MHLQEFENILEDVIKLIRIYSILSRIIFNALLTDYQNAFETMKNFKANQREFVNTTRYATRALRISVHASGQRPELHEMSVEIDSSQRSLIAAIFKTFG